MDRNRLSGRLANLPVEQAPQLPHSGCHSTSTHRTFAMAIAGLAAFAAVACLPTPMPGTASRATGFPTGDPPRSGLTASEVDAPPAERIPDIIEGCFDPFDFSSLP